MRLWCAVLVLGAVADVCLTAAVLGSGGAEANPVMAWVFGRFGFGAGAAAKAAVALWAAFFLPAVAPGSRLAGPGLVFCALVQAAVAVWGLLIVMLVS